MLGREVRLQRQLELAQPPACAPETDQLADSQRLLQGRGAQVGLTATLEARGHAALEARATSAYEEFVAPGSSSVRRRDNVDRLGDVVKFNWEMISTGAEVAAVGLEFLVLGPDDRIRRDYQFVES
jgi:hypothetical protein